MLLVVTFWILVIIHLFDISIVYFFLYLFLYLYVLYVLFFPFIHNVLFFKKFSSFIHTMHSITHVWFQGVQVNTKASDNHTARSLAGVHGHIKIVSLIDSFTARPLTSRLPKEKDLSSSDEAYQHPRHHGGARGSKVKGRGQGPSIQDGPQAFAKLINNRGHGEVSPNAAVNEKQGEFYTLDWLTHWHSMKLPKFGWCEFAKLLGSGFSQLWLVTRLEY